MTTVTLDTDTTVHTLYGRQMCGRNSYNAKNKVAAYEQAHCQFVIVARKTRRLVEQLQEPLPANNTFSGLRHVLQVVRSCIRSAGLPFGAALALPQDLTELQATHNVNLISVKRTFHSARPGAEGRSAEAEQRLQER